MLSDNCGLYFGSNTERRQEYATIWNISMTHKVSHESDKILQWKLINF